MEKAWILDNKSIIDILIKKSVELDGYKNAVIVCDENNKILSIGYNTFVYGKTRKFSETLNKDFKEKGDRYYVIDAFTNALVNLIKVNHDKKHHNLTIYTTNLPNAQATKLLSYFNVSTIINYNMSPYMLFPKITENYDLENDENNLVIKLIAKEKRISLLEFDNLNIKHSDYNFNIIDFTDKIYSRIDNVNHNLCNLLSNECLNDISGILALLDKFSDDAYFQVSACLIDKNLRIVNCSTNILPNNTEKSEFKIQKERKRKFILCAEQVLLFDSIFKNINLEDKILITNAMPCYMCAKMIVEFRIKNVIVLDFEKFEKIDFTDEVSEDIFTNANVNYKIIKKI